MKNIFIVTLFLAWSTILYSQNTAQEYYNSGLKHLIFNDTENNPNCEKARQYFTKAIELNPNFDSAYFERGKLLIGCNKYNDAKNDLNKAIELKYNILECKYLLYRICTYQNDTICSNRLLSELLKENYYAKDIYNTLADNAAFNGDFKTAITFYNVILKHDILDQFVLLNTGYCKYQLGDLTGAITDYNQALTIDPNFVDAYINRASVKQLIGDIKGACEDYNKAIQIDSSDQDLIKTVRQICK